MYSFIIVYYMFVMSNDRCVLFVHTLMTRLIVRQLIKIDVITDELSLPFSTPEQLQAHPLAGRITLLTAYCNGKLWWSKAAPRPSSKHFCKAVELVQTGCCGLLWAKLPIPVRVCWNAETCDQGHRTLLQFHDATKACGSCHTVNSKFCK